MDRLMLFMDIYRASISCALNNIRYLTLLTAMISVAFSLGVLVDVETDLAKFSLGLATFVVAPIVVIAIHRLVALNETRVCFSWERYFKYIFIVLGIIIIIMVPVFVLIYMNIELYSEGKLSENTIGLLITLLYLLFTLYLPAIAIGVKPVDRTLFFVSLKHYPTILLVLGPVALLYVYVPVWLEGTVLAPISGLFTGILIVGEALLLSTTYKVLILDPPLPDVSEVNT